MAYLDNTGVGTLWSRIKTYIAGLGFYTKPSTGIPASDIASGVIPTVPSNIVTGLDSSGVATAYTIKVVDSLPDTPDSSTIYLVTGS